MMSDSNYVFDPEQKKVIPFPGHFMFPAPYISAEDLGSRDGQGVPYIVHPGMPDALIIVIPAQSGSSGAGPEEHGH